MSRIVVIGGGPGGSAAATMLARKGHDVILFERERFPREHIGESLLPASVALLEALGVRDAMEQAGFLKKWGATMVWGTESEPWSWYFRETNKRYPHSYQVERGQFDQILLDNARHHGVEVHEGVRVVEVLFDNGHTRGVRIADASGGQRDELADFIVDASGQAAVIGRSLNFRRWDPFFRNMAVYGYFEGAHRLPEPDQTNILVESYASGWFWTIPLHTGRTSVGAVVDRDIAQSRLKGRELQDFLLSEIAMAPKTSDLLRDAHLVSGPFSIRDWSYMSDAMVGDGFILVGDAACFVDPLFSSGVHLALSAGVMAAAYVATALKDHALATAAGPVYERLYSTQYERFHEMAKLFYSSNRTMESYFWEARRILGGDESYTPRQDFIRAVAGQPAQGYERAVLAQGELPPTFLAGIKQAEDERASRQARLSRDASSLAGAIPRLAVDAKVAPAAVLGADEFEWGYSLTSKARPEGVDCSAIVADLLTRIDGRRSVQDLIEAVAVAYPESARNQLSQHLLFAVRTLYVEGAIEDLSGL